MNRRRGPRWWGSSALDVSRRWEEDGGDRYLDGLTHEVDGGSLGDEDAVDGDVVDGFAGGGDG